MLRSIVASIVTFRKSYLFPYHYLILRFDLYLILTVNFIYHQYVLKVQLFKFKTFETLNRYYTNNGIHIMIIIMEDESSKKKKAGKK